MSLPASRRWSTRKLPRHPRAASSGISYPQTSHLPLRQNTWVDLRGGITEEGLDRLQLGGHRDQASSPRRRLPGPTALPSPQPPLPPLSQISSKAATRSLLPQLISRRAQTTAITQAQTIHGLGGIGKTRLAVEYAWRSGESIRHRVLRRRGNSPEALHSNLANLARPELLNLPRTNAPDQKEHRCRRPPPGSGSTTAGC